MKNKIIASGKIVIVTIALVTCNISAFVISYIGSFVLQCLDVDQDITEGVWWGSFTVLTFAPLFDSHPQANKLISYLSGFIPRDDEAPHQNS